MRMKTFVCVKKSGDDKTISPQTINDESSGKFKTVYDYELYRFTNVTTFHGLIRLYQGRPIAKLFWTVVVVFALTCFLIQCTNLIKYFLSKPTVAQVQLVTTENGTEFPAVTICNYNPVKKSSLTAFNMTESLVKYILSSFLQTNDLHSQFAEEDVKLMRNEYKTFTNNWKNFSLDDFFMKVGYSCEDMFLQCSFAGLPMNCCDFAVPILTDMGKCFQFKQYSNHSWLNRQYIPGPRYGFQAFINAHLNEYPKAIASYYQNGIRTFVHPRNALLYLNTGGQSVSPGQMMYSSVEQIHHILLPPEQWGNCRQKWDDQQNIDYPYSSSLCQARCIAQFYTQNCNCIPLQYKLASDTRVCDPVELYDCISAKNMHDVEQKFQLHQQCSCAAECDLWDYQIATSYASIPNPGSIESLQKRLHMSEDEIKQNLIVVDVYLNKMNYVEYKQLQATSLTTTLSNIGGNMGMFIGASLVTCVELMVFFFKILWDSCSKTRRNNLFRKQISGAACLSSNVVENSCQNCQTVAVHNTGSLYSRNCISVSNVINSQQQYYAALSNDKTDTQDFILWI